MNKTAKNKHELVSVIIPTFNRANTIVAAVQSVLCQTYDNLEVIVIDDCSSDNTEEIISNIHDNRIFYHKLDKNRRACYARNFGYSLSHGTYIAFHDSDDVWHSDKIAKQLDYIKRNQFDFIFCGMNRLYPNGNIFFYPTAKFDVSKDFFHQELMENVVSTQTMFMRREVMEKIKFDESFKRFQDWDFAIRVAKEYKIGYISEALVDSYIQKNSVTATISGYESLDHLYKKYESYICSNSHILAYYERGYGDSIRRNNPKTAYKHYKKSLYAEFNLKTFCKAILSFLRIKF